MKGFHLAFKRRNFWSGFNGFTARLREGNRDSLPPPTDLTCTASPLSVSTPDRHLLHPLGPRHRLVLPHPRSKVFGSFPVWLERRVQHPPRGERGSRPVCTWLLSSVHGWC